MNIELLRCKRTDDTYQEIRNRHYVENRGCHGQQLHYLIKLDGVVVGIIFHTLTRDGRVRSVADVIEAAALHDGRVEQKEGVASALASLITLSTGGSAGREGPVVHIAAMISSKVCDWIGARGITARDLLGCGVAAAV